MYCTMYYLRRRGGVSNDRQYIDAAEVDRDDRDGHAVPGARPSSSHLSPTSAHISCHHPPHQGHWWSTSRFGAYSFDGLGVDQAWQTMKSVPLAIVSVHLHGYHRHCRWRVSTRLWRTSQLHSAICYDLTRVLQSCTTFMTSRDGSNTVLWRWSFLRWHSCSLVLLTLCWPNIGVVTDLTGFETRY